MSFPWDRWMYRIGDSSEWVTTDRYFDLGASLAAECIVQSLYDPENHPLLGYIDVTLKKESGIYAENVYSRRVHVYFVPKFTVLLP